jgi:multisubunit Na+/H+ antiporter MnhB subunit
MKLFKGIMIVIKDDPIVCLLGFLVGVIGFLLYFLAYTDMYSLSVKELVLLAYCSYVIFSCVIAWFILLAVALLVKELLSTLVRVFKNKFFR